MPASRVFSNIKNYNQHAVIELSQYEDILDVFIHIVILRLPTAFVMINITVMIWLVQAIYSSNSGISQYLSRSLYYFGPFIVGRPLIDIEVGNRNQIGCKPGYQLLTLKTFPIIRDESLNHLNLTKWKQSTLFCGKYSQNIPNFTLTPASCIPQFFYCSGLCVNRQDECPITFIHKLSAIDPLISYQKQFYTTKDGLYRYFYSRQSRENLKSYITGISAQYQYRCANQFQYMDTFQTFGEYWDKTKQCGSQGFLSADFYHTFDSMQTSQFLFSNGIWSEKINKKTRGSIVQLGFLSNLNYKNNTKCRNSQKLAYILQKGLLLGIQLNGKNLLIISFVLFNLSWVWLLSLYCCQGRIVYKNSIAIIMSIIQLITFMFIYSQNEALFQFQDAITGLAGCVDQPMTAFQNWPVGIFNRYPLKIIIFSCSSFILFQIVAYFIYSFLYEPYISTDHSSIKINHDEFRHINEQNIQNREPQTLKKQELNFFHNIIEGQY